MRDGKIHALTVTTAEHASDLPDVRTVKAAGFQRSEASARYALAAAAGTPGEIVDTLNAAANAFLPSSKGEGALARASNSQPIHREPGGRQERTDRRDHRHRLADRRAVCAAFHPGGGRGDSPIVGIDELRWRQVVRLGDALRSIREIVEVRRSESKPDRGVIRTRVTVLNSTARR